jgi:hypothetical protein
LSFYSAIETNRRKFRLNQKIALRNPGLSLFALVEVATWSCGDYPLQRIVQDNADMLRAWNEYFKDSTYDKPWLRRSVSLTKPVLLILRTVEL